MFPYKTKYSSHGFCLVVSGGAVAYTFPEECWEGIEEEKGVERGKEGRRKKCNTKAWGHKVEHFYENQLAVATVQYTD